MRKSQVILISFLAAFTAGATAASYLFFRYGSWILPDRFSQINRIPRARLIGSLAEPQTLRQNSWTQDQITQMMPQLQTQAQQEPPSEQDPKTQPPLQSQSLTKAAPFPQVQQPERKQDSASLPLPGSPSRDQGARPRVVPHPAEPSGHLAGYAVGIGPPAPPDTVADAIAELRQRELVLPLKELRKEDLKDSFKESRRGHVHEAIDILAPRNTPVLAVEDGTIARLWYSIPGGITIYQFDPEKKYEYYYAHLESYAKGLKEGSRVKQGQVIGYVGTSGNAPQNTPHLHFTVFKLTEEKHWWEGTAINPYLIFK